MNTTPTENIGTPAKGFSKPKPDLKIRKPATVDDDNIADFQQALAKKKGEIVPDDHAGVTDENCYDLIPTAPNRKWIDHHQSLTCFFIDLQDEPAYDGKASDEDKTARLRIIARNKAIINARRKNCFKVDYPPLLPPIPAPTDENLDIRLDETLAQARERVQNEFIDYEKERVENDRLVKLLHKFRMEMCERFDINDPVYTITPDNAESVRACIIEKVVREVNKNHAKVSYGKDAPIMWIKENAKLETELVFQSEQTFASWIAEKKVTLPKITKGDEDNKVSTETVSVSKLWKESTHKRKYENIAYRPGCDVGENITKNGKVVFNTWTGWAAAPLDDDSKCQRILNHIREVLCNSDEKLFNYLLMWFADIFIDPMNKKGTVPVFQGSQGCGKGIILNDLIGWLIGQSYFYLNNPNQLVGHFNAHISDKLFIYLDESFFAGNKEDASILKALITNEIITVERKGIDALNMDSYFRLAIASNEAWVVPIEPTNRRYFVLRCGEQYSGDTTGYFTALANEIKANDHEGARAFMGYLLKYALRTDKKVDLRKPPLTHAAFHQIVRTFDNETAWWYEDVLIKGQIYNDLTPDEDPIPDYVSHRRLYDSYKRFIKDTGRNSWSKSDTALAYHLKTSGLCPYLGNKEIVRGKAKLHSLTSENANTYDERLTELRNNFLRYLRYTPVEFEWTSTGVKSNDNTIIPTAEMIDCVQTRDETTNNAHRLLMGDIKPTKASSIFKTAEPTVLYTRMSDHMDDEDDIPFEIDTTRPQAQLSKDNDDDAPF